VEDLVLYVRPIKKMKIYTDIRFILNTRKMNMPKGVIRDEIKTTYFLPAQSMIFVNKILPTENEIKLITPISPIL
jgi:hypothetical protein